LVRINWNGENIWGLSVSERQPPVTVFNEKRPEREIQRHLIAFEFKRNTNNSKLRPAPHYMLLPPGESVFINYCPSILK